jgi:hypothetical protein
LLIGLVHRGISDADWYLVAPVDNTLDQQMDWFNAMPDEVIADMFDDDKFVQLEKKQPPLTADGKEKITEGRNAPGCIIKWEGRPFCITLAAKYSYVVDEGNFIHLGQTSPDLAVPTIWVRSSPCVEAPVTVPKSRVGQLGSVE